MSHDDRDMDDSEVELESSEESSGSSNFDEDDALSFSDQESYLDETPLTDEEVKELLDQLLQVESQAAEAQELLEEESLAKLTHEVRMELAENLVGSELNEAVHEEINTYVDIWKEKLEELEDQSALLQERLEDSGVDLPELFKWIEKQAPEGCMTDTWRSRTHWAGVNATEEANKALKEAENHLEVLRPVKRRHGKFFEEGASGFLGKKFAANGSQRAGASCNGWDSLETLVNTSDNMQTSHVFDSAAWAKVYLAATPQQAALLGVPGADVVEEILDVDNCPTDPYIAAALEYEKDIGLTDKIKKVLEEDDIRKGKLIQRLAFRHRRFTKLRPTKLDMATWEATHGTDVENAIHSRFYQDGPSCLLTSNALFENEIAKMPHVKAEKDVAQLGKLEDSQRPTNGASFSIPDNLVINIDSDDEEIVVETIQPEIQRDDSMCDDTLIVPSWKMKVDDAMDTVDSIDSKPVTSRGGAFDINRKLVCTICRENLRLNDVHRHPLLEISVCRECLKFYKSISFTKDTNGYDNECLCCANGGDLVMCESCKKVVCKTCLENNLGSDEVDRIVNSTQEWQCFCCDLAHLKPFIEQFKDAMKKQHVKQVNSELHEDRTRHESRRKRLRRIREDDELEESTKMKQAHEKERKERLERLREVAFTSTRSYMSEDASLQECSINIARDADEEAVLIPFGLAKFLKPYQIEGVRFMWDNCIESLKKLKSGDLGNGCILAHNMGLGKTLQVITFLYTVLREDMVLRTALIVTPLNVLHNWPDEFEKWKPAELRPLQVHVLDDTSKNERKRQLRLWKKLGGVMIIGYTAFRIMSIGKHIKDAVTREKINKALQDPGPDILICDEAHMIKNKKADITQALKQVRTQRRIALTGSPLQNNLMEYYCMVDFVREGFLGKPQDFKNRFQNPIENGQHADSTQYDVRIMKERTHILHKQLSGFVQRKGASIVEKELPPKFIYVISVRLSSLQRALYNRFVQKFWLSDENDTIITKFRKSLFYTYHTLAKVWNHPDLLFNTQQEMTCESEDSEDEFITNDDGGYSSDESLLNPKKEGKIGSQRTSKKKDTEGINEINSLNWCQDLLVEKQPEVLVNSGKFVLLLDILSMSSTRGEKCLVFSQSLLTLNLIEVFIQRLPRPDGGKGGWRKDIEWYRLDGRTKAKERQKLVKHFNDPNNFAVQCILISTRAGSLGINLQAANRVVIIDGSWNPTHDMQAFFRAWRFGQQKPVMVYRLLACSTAEEKIYKRQVAKESLAARVLDEHQIGRHSKMDDLKVLFELDDGDRNPEESCATNDYNSSFDGSQTAESSPLKQAVDFTEINVSNDNTPEDEIMNQLLLAHYPRWIVKVHQHDSLLVDREEEKLTDEEQRVAWERYKILMSSPTNNIDWVQVSSEAGIETSNADSQPFSSLGNLWSLPKKVVCSSKTHLELLVHSRANRNDKVHCEICQRLVGWEDISKRTEKRKKQ